ncbi:MAG: SusC/RagA family TonB-linked outer membrane protein [Saprospiraceae bacterium]|nr:SusC/RagA family TonB-linked outer membrane protein [Saprospiraceae bacterium]
MKKSYVLSLLMVLFGAAYSIAQTVTGTVTDIDGEPLIGVNILEAGTTNGTVTDIDGSYTIELTTTDPVLQISYTGFATQSVEVQGLSVVDVVLKQGVQLDEVVVTALGISREKKALSYSAQGVSSDEMKQARSPNVLNTLSGKVAGLSITGSGQGVGGDSKVILRGNRSISGSSEPLYIVDGIVMNGDISNLSPDDIQEISVLKGANAAALYGSRANNGAIVVTTKSGKGAPNGVTTSLGITFQAETPIHLLKFQNEYGQGSAGSYSPVATTSWGPKMTGQQVDHWSIDPNYPLYGKTYALEAQPDNITDFFRTGHTVATNLGVNIKSDNSNTYLSYTYTDAGGIVPSNDYNSHNLGLRVTSEIVPKITTDMKINYIRDDFANVLDGGEGYTNPMRYLYILPRNIRTEDVAHYQFTNASGQNRQHYWLPRFNGGGNPYWTINNITAPQLRERVTGLLSLKYQITKDLSILGRSALDRSNVTRENIRYVDTYTTANGGQYIKTFNNSYEWNSDFLANYNKAISSNITLDLNFGGNVRKTKFDQLQASGVNFNIENLFALGNTADPRPSEGSASNPFYTEKEVQSIYGFGSLGFFNALYLEFSGRNDWSSTLPAANRSYFYPSFGVTAVLSDLMTLPDFFSFLKLRGSWAEVGSDTGPYQLSRGATVAYGTVSLSSTLPNADLLPETTQSTEFGVDARFLNNRLRLDFTYYKTNTFDQLFSIATPVASGIASRFLNGADIQNKGVEFVIGATPVSNSKLTWDIDFNFAKNNSEVLELAEGLTTLNLGSTTGFMTQYRVTVGQPFGEIYSRGFQRDAQGRVLVNAEGLPLVTAGLNTPVANYNPDWLGGINNAFTYGNWNLSFLIDIRQGGTFTSNSDAILAGDGFLDYTLNGREGGLVFGQDVFAGETAVLEDGTPNTIATNAEKLWNVLGGRNAPTGEAFVRDASNVRLREFILGYRIPKFKARVSLVGRNLFFISNKAEYVDPEILVNTGRVPDGQEGFSLPTTRSFGLNLNIDF